MLTARQAQVLRVIEAGIANTGASPSYREIAERCRISSMSQVSAMIDALEARGFVRRLGEPGAPRALEVIKPQTQLNTDYQRGFQDGVEAMRRKLSEPGE